MRTSDGLSPEIMYDVCLSFAGEQRDYVDRVATHLRQANVRVFYDRYETVNLWGEDLVHYLDQVYRYQARFCVMFVSSDYEQKIWTTHERRSIQARAIHSATAYVLPVRFDDTEISGLLDTVGLLRAADLTPEEVAEFVIAKLAGPSEANDARPLEYAPRTALQENRSVSGHYATRQAKTEINPGSRVITSQLVSLTPVVGRATLLKTLNDAFHSGARSPSTPPVLRIITGTGGIGKSSIARAYGAENQDQYGLIWWVRAEETAMMVEDFRNLLVALGMKNVQRLEQPVQLAHMMLTNRPSRWLLIFDNVPQQSSLRGLVPPAGAGDIIVTSRSSSWANVKTVMTVPPLPADVGAALLREISQDNNESDSRALFDELGGLPLALHQAGSYVAENPIDLAEYLRLYREHRPQLHHLGSAPDYDLLVDTMWEVSFKMLPETAQTILNVLAWFAPEVIPLDLLSRRSAIDGVPDTFADRINAAFADEIDYLNAVSSLSRYGLITVNRREANIHRLTQAVTRDNAATSGSADEWATAAAAVLLAAVPTPPANAERINAWLRLRPHILHHQRLSPVTDTETSLRLRHWTAQWTGEVGRPGEAMTLLAELIDRQVRVLGDTHPDTLRSRHSQAQWTGESGDFDAATALFDRLMALWHGAAGPDHPEALRAHHSSAYWVGESGRPIEACSRLRDVLTRRQRVLGAEHPDTLRTMHSLAYRTGQTGDYPTACAMLEQLLPIRIRILGHDHPHTLRTRYSLAQSLGRGGDSVRARDVTAALLSDQSRALGKDHPHTLRTRYNLAHWTGMAGDRAGERQALALLLEDQIRVLGTDHPDTRLTRVTLGDAT